MRIKLRGQPNAQAIAEIHDALAEACRALDKAFMVPTGMLGGKIQRMAISKESADKLHRISMNIRDAMFSLENPFFHANDENIESPLSQTEQEKSWTIWLQKKTELTIRTTK